ncbi:MAG: flippase-like domain-containing protein [Acidobacteria bacterium]|nr:flippase-like domain-containing protein [Acidobacteriota bacterium]
MQVRHFKLKFTLWLIVAAGLVYYFAHRLEWAEVRASFRELNLSLAAASILPILATYLARALRWRAFLAPMGRPSVRNLFAATVIGFSSIFVFGRVGEVTRPVILSLRERIRPSATVATIMIERLFDSTAVVLLFAIDVAFFGHLDSHQLVTVRQVGLGLLIASSFAIGGLSIFRWRANAVLGFLETSLSWLPKKIHRVLLNLLRHLADGLYVLHDVRGLLVTGGYTMLVWALVTLSFWLVVRAFGLPLPVASIIFILGFALVGSLVPTPGGSAGAFHTVTMVALVLLGVEQNKAASVAIAMHFVAFGSALVFGIYFLVRDGISFTRLRAIVAEEMVSLHDVAGRATEDAEAQTIGAKP